MMEQSPGSATLESIAEAPTEATHSQRPPPTDEEIASVFRECDTSGDGFIDLSELCAALGKAGQPASRETARAMLLQVDANGDEQISLDEFRQIFLLDAPDELKGLAGNFDRFIDEVRFEVDSTEFNGPILLTAFTAASTGIFWKSIVAFAALYTSSEGFVGGAEQLPALVEVFKSIPAGFLTDYSKAVELAPLLTMSCTSMFAYAIGDLVGQGVEGRRRVDLLDLGRCARNAALGFGLHGPLVYGWIQILEGPFASAMGGGQAEWATLLIKIFLDQTLFSALINILYASLNGILSNMSPQEAFARARQVLVPAMVSSWRFWPAVQLISYSPLIPVDFKLLWIDTMEILWVAYLSATVNSGGASGDADAIPWGEGRLFDRAASSAVVVLDEPGDSDLLYVGPLVLLTSLTTLGGLLWPQLVVQMMS